MYRDFIRYLFLIVLLLPLGACHKEPKVRIGVAQCSTDDWRRKMNDEIRREIMLHDNVEVEIVSADDDSRLQADQVRRFMDEGFDVICLAPNEAEPLTAVVNEAADRGIPLVVFDRNVNTDRYTAFQGADNEGIGRAAAQYAMRLTGGKGKVIELTGLLKSTPAAERMKGFDEEIERHPGTLEIVARAEGKWTDEDAALVADSLLDIHPDADIIYAHNDRMAIAARRVASQKGLSPKIIGIDAAPEIGMKAVADTVIDATFVYPTDGYSLVRTALAIHEGKPYEKVVKLPVPSAVNLSNANILLQQNEALKEESIKVEGLKNMVDDYWRHQTNQSIFLYLSLIILVLLVGFLFMVLRAYWEHRRTQAILLEQNRQLEQQRDQEKQLNEQISQATQSKLMFFTNVSHDLRTPLTLIQGPLEELSSATNLTSAQTELVKVANRNARILHRLINQILDFRKYENGKIDLNLTETDFGQLMRGWLESFTPLAKSRHMHFRLDFPESGPEGSENIALDPEKIERVVFNLVSNAFKYTPDNGSIEVSYRFEGEKVVVSVKDNGRGVSEEDLPNIFMRFFQVDKVHPNGSGIGLSLAKSFVELHGGSMSAESTLGKGSVFTFTLPVRHVADHASEVAPGITTETVSAELERTELPVAPAAPVPDEASRQPVVLVIDDNDDMRRVVGSLLSDSYVIISAKDGQEGLRLAAKYIPDLIICDVMMPVMDGLECCRLLKGEMSTSHIPVLMLTACSMDEQRVSGYDSGADGCLAKPFSNDVLRAQVKSLISNRRLIRDLWRGEGRAVPETGAADDTPKGASLPPVATDIDNEFYTRFLHLFLENISDPDVSVDSLAAKMGMGRSQFYRKIKALTNFSPVELMRHLRLKQSRHLLTTTEKTVSEIAYEVGFSNPAYFTKCYREAYGETPTALRERLSGTRQTQR